MVKISLLAGASVLSIFVGLCDTGWSVESSSSQEENCSRNIANVQQDMRPIMDSADEIILEYKGYPRYSQLCPTFTSPEEIQEFFQALNRTKLKGKKLYFDFHGRQWSIDSDFLGRDTPLRANIGRTGGAPKYNDDKSDMLYFFIDTIKLVNSELVPEDARGPERLRCHYKGYQVNSSPDNPHALFTLFTITTLLP